MRRVFLFLLIMPILVLGDDSESEPYKSMLARLKRNPALNVSIMGGWTIVQIAGEAPYSIWSFSPEGHPAHPAFAQRTVIQDKTGAWRVKTEMSCGASKSECDKLMLEYEALDEKMKDALSKDKGN